MGKCSLRDRMSSIPALIPKSFSFVILIIRYVRSQHSHGLDKSVIQHIHRYIKEKWNPLTLIYKYQLIQ